MITSLQNSRVKDAVRLRDRRHREKQGRIVIDGARELGRAIRAGVRLRDVYVCESLCQGEEARRVLEMLADAGEEKGDKSNLPERPGGCFAQIGLIPFFPPEILHVSEPVFEKLAFGERAEGVLGVAETPAASIDCVQLPENALVAVLEGVEKPGNVGAVLRSADAAGVSALIVADGGTDLYNPNAIRASLGTIFTVPVAAATTGETVAWLRQHGLAIYAARVDASAQYTEVDLRRPAAIVLGSEAAGLSAAWTADDITPIRLPMLGVVDSLNVSAAAAVLFYEAMRQRERRGMGIGD
jgi:RNA methyltransferase, TrmH family